METAFLVCAILLVCQVLAGFLGFGAEHDAGGLDHDQGDGHHDNGFLKMLSVRTVTAAVLFFGLGGLTAGYYGADDPTAFGLAALAGLGALYAVSALMDGLAGLKADGTARVDGAVGRTGTVYLRVPAGRAGPGKVHLALQNRTVEYQAVTGGAELPTGAAVKVVAVVGPDTVEVEAA
jgi:hypothetical protein